MTRLALCLCPLLLWAAACSEGASPTFPDGPAVIEGTVEHQGRSEHDFEMDNDGLFEVRLADVRLLLVDITQTPASGLTFGFGLGQRNDLGNCTLTTNFVLLEGERATYRLSNGSYCLTVFDPGVFPENALLGYRLEIQISI
jgi:hypothetical protein